MTSEPSEAGEPDEPPDETGEKKYVGFVPTESLPIKRGDVVRIRKGVVVKTVGRDAKPAGRGYKVKVHHVFNGSAPCAPYRADGVELPGSNPKVVCRGPRLPLYYEDLVLIRAAIATEGSTR